MIIPPKVSLELMISLGKKSQVDGPIREILETIPLNAEVSNVLKLSIQDPVDGVVTPVSSLLESTTKNQDHRMKIPG